jgi:glutamate formiminotransferase/formiminotetrahydrofolate cyclodeaminase
MSQSNPLVECVPNISEGRDQAVIDQVVAAAAAVDGVEVLDVDPGRETNRTVITFVGAPDAVVEGAFQLIGKAAELIDMSKQTGAHARHGATDVCPFVPVSDVTMEDCVELAGRLGQRVGDELGIPVYLYDQAARRPERRSLAKVRVGEYEALPDKLGKPEWEPDFGPATFLPRTGVVTIGAREFLIAYNVNLNSMTKAHADDIAGELRETGRAFRTGQATPYYTSGKLVKYDPANGRFPSAYDDFVGSTLDELAAHYTSLGRDLHADLAFFGRDPESLQGVNVMKRGRFEHCRGVGWVIPEYRKAQMSFNLTDFHVTPAHGVFDACAELATERGLRVTGSEVVGMVPWEAMRETGEHYLTQQGASRGVPVVDVVETGVQSMGLADVAPFDAKKSVLGLPTTDGPLVSLTVNGLADEVSRPSPAPGGGSLAALAGSLGAALAAMVANLTFSKKGMESQQESMEALAMEAQGVKDELLRAVDADTEAFGCVLDAMRLPKDTAEQKSARAAAIQDGYKQATDVPYQSALACLAALHLCKTAAEEGMPASVTDAGVGAMLARSGVIGAVLNVKINLTSITDEAWVADRRGQLDVLVSEARALEESVLGVVEGRL